MAEIGADEMVLIPSPYKGLTARLGRREVNVHEVVSGEVLYGLYDDDAEECPHRCVGTYRLPVEDFINRLGRSILDGAVTFSLLNTDRQQELF